MKAVFIAFTLKNSSVAEFFVELANQLATNNKVIIITHSVEPHALEIYKNIEILRWPGKRPTGIKDFLFLSKLVFRYKPEIMIANFAAVNIFLIVGFIFGTHSRIAWYHTLTSQLKVNKTLAFRKKIIYKLATQIITNSQAGKIDLTENFNINPSKIDVVYNAVPNPNLINKPELDKLVFAGRLEDIKGIEILIKAMPLVCEQFPEIKLVIIGGELQGEQGKKYQKMVSSFSIEKNVIFLGNQSRQTVLQEFSTAYATIVPSLSEAFGYVIIESFSVGTPVIGSNTTGIAEIISEGENGLLFTPGDYLELSKKIIFLIQWPEKRKEMSRESYNSFISNFEKVSVINNLCEKL